MTNFEKVKKLRAVTGVGIKNCKKALEDAHGSVQKAVHLLRALGVVKALERSDKKTSEGVVCYYSTDKKASAVKITSETDFVAKNQLFLSLADTIALAAHSFYDGSIRDFLKSKIEKNVTILDLINEKIHQLGENIILERVSVISIPDGIIIPYVHNKYNNRSGKILVLVALEGEIFEEMVHFGKFVAMHIAASSPLSLSINTLDNKLIERERNIFMKQAQNTTKPKLVIEKIIAGKIQKFFSQVVLTHQYFVMNNNETVGSLLQKLNKKFSFQLKDYINFAIGK
jgi:elongation factor Ts